MGKIIKLKLFGSILVSITVVILWVLSGNADAQIVAYKKAGPKAPCVGITVDEKIKIHSGPCATSEVIAVIAKEMETVEVNEITSLNYKIPFSDPEVEYPWIGINYKRSKKGYISGRYLEMFETAEKAEYFVKKNIEFRKFIKGKWKFVPPEEYKYLNYSYNFVVTLNENGTLAMKVDGVVGDHLEWEEGTGRYYFNLPGKRFKFYARLKGEFHPDGISWEKYFQFENKDSAELKKLIKEFEHYKRYRAFEIIAEDWEHDLQDVLVKPDPK